MQSKDGDNRIIRRGKNSEGELLNARHDTESFLSIILPFSPWLLSSYLIVDETEARELVWVHTSGETGSQGSKPHIGLQSLCV